MKAQATAIRIFISYSRADIEFVDRLQFNLHKVGIETLVDRLSIEKGEDWWQRIRQLIADCDAAVFVLTPDFIASDVCQKELSFAEYLNKRLIPIVARAVDNKNVPASLSRLNYVHFVAGATFGENADFNNSISTLQRILTTDLAWVREHARIGGLAMRWAESGRSNDDLLRGSSLKIAEAWLLDRPKNAPELSIFHKEFLAKSQANESFSISQSKRRLKRAVAASLMVALTFAIIAIYAYHVSIIAIMNETLAILRNKQVHLASEKFVSLSRYPGIAAWSASEDAKRLASELLDSPVVRRIHPSDEIGKYIDLNGPQTREDDEGKLIACDEDGKYCFAAYSDADNPDIDLVYQADASLLAQYHDAFYANPLSAHATVATAMAASGRPNELNDKLFFDLANANYAMAISRDGVFFVISKNDSLHFWRRKSLEARFPREPHAIVKLGFQPKRMAFLGVGPDLIVQDQGGGSFHIAFEPRRHMGLMDGATNDINRNLGKLTDRQMPAPAVSISGDGNTINISGKNLRLKDPRMSSIISQVAGPGIVFLSPTVLALPLKIELCQNSSEKFETLLIIKVDREFSMVEAGRLLACGPTLRGETSKPITVSTMRSMVPVQASTYISSWWYAGFIEIDQMGRPVRQLKGCYAFQEQPVVRMDDWNGLEVYSFSEVESCGTGLATAIIHAPRANRLLFFAEPYNLGRVGREGSGHAMAQSIDLATLSVEQLNYTTRGLADKIFSVDVSPDESFVKVTRDMLEEKIETIYLLRGGKRVALPWNWKSVDLGLSLGKVLRVQLWASEKKDAGDTIGWIMPESDGSEFRSVSNFLGEAVKFDNLRRYSARWNRKLDRP